MLSKERQLVRELEIYPDYLSLEQMRKACHISKRKATSLIESGAVMGKKTGRFTCCYKIPKKSVVKYLLSLEESPETITVRHKTKAIGKQFEIPNRKIDALKKVYQNLISDWPDALNTQVLSELLGYEPGTIRQWVKEEYLPVSKVGRKNYIVKDDICSFMASERFRLLPAKSPQHIELEQQARKKL